MDHNCFALKEDSSCNALSVEECIGSTCSFYKTIEQYNESCKNADARVASLNEEKQRELAVKYYNGKMPWRAG